MKKSAPIIILALLAIAAIAVIKLQKSGVEPRVPLETPKIDYGPLIKMHADQASRRNVNAIQSFELEIGRILKAHETKLAKAADAAAKEGADYQSCCAIIYYPCLGQSKKDFQNRRILGFRDKPNDRTCGFWVGG